MSTAREDRCRKSEGTVTISVLSSSFATLGSPINPCIVLSKAKRMGRRRSSSCPLDVELQAAISSPLKLEAGLFRSESQMARNVLSLRLARARRFPPYRESSSSCLRRMRWSRSEKRSEETILPLPPHKWFRHMHQ